MAELLPTLAAASVADGLLEYLRTTFALTDATARDGLSDFLTDPVDGIFKGPYLRTRLPFAPAPDGWRETLGWHPIDDGGGFVPYGHQAAAFARLSSLNLPPGQRPSPTVVTTGTGSGKTEAFLYPILDHVVRANQAGVSGIKALLLYPMNALATDQADRLAELITTHSQLSGITAGIYTGQTGPARKTVSAAGLISDRYAMRESPPDILLTNYKMLDQLLLREEDRNLWAASAASLQYLVLDEFHTYDGAQGTDVSMLLRRLGLALRDYGAPGDFTQRPLGNITPVATSATLGDKGDPATMLAFATTVFGEPLDADAVITETRLSLDEWLNQASATVTDEPRSDTSVLGTIPVVAERIGFDPDPAYLVAELLPVLYEREFNTDELADLEVIGELVRAHPLTAKLLAATQTATSLDEVAQECFATSTEAQHEAAVATIRLHGALLSHLRAQLGRGWPAIELHLWLRELTRIDREASTQATFFWSDDGTMADDGEAGLTPVFPAIYCRHCGHSGWAIALSPANEVDLDTTDEAIRRNWVTRQGRTRSLIYAPREGETALGSAPDNRSPSALPAPGAAPTNLRWFDPVARTIVAALPSEAEVREGTVLPVLVDTDIEADARARHDMCPACEQRDAIRFVGSAIAIQLSVGLSILFGHTSLDSEQKKTLVFTDSVQDAAHRAGYIQARSHSMAVRSILRQAIGDDTLSLDQLADRAIAQAGDDQSLRFRILPPDLADKPEFKDFWDAATLAKIPAGVRNRVRRRLAFDATLEFGLQSVIGRTLELTGTVAAEVQASRGHMLASVHGALENAGSQALIAAAADEATLLMWVRGMLEHIRQRGGVEHEWLKKFIHTDGTRYFIWGGRPRAEGMPAFPTGRSAPAFPRVGKKPQRARDSLLDQVTTPRSWYTQWTRRCLQVSPEEATVLAKLLLDQLVEHDLLASTNTQSGATVYAIPATRILLSPVEAEALASGQHRLVCTQCGTRVPGTATTIDQLEQAPCPLSRCAGRLARANGDPENFYRRAYNSREIQRVIAREHTSLLDDKTRLKYESGFKGHHDNPDAPNVLVATPTLEMGIDIGDLTTVMLASLPRSVASYLQRIGRAGRLSGSALNMAFVSGRGEQLPRVGDPTSMINGQVRPPATYLDAEEILRRQFIAYLADQQARDPNGIHPRTAVGAISSIEPDSYLYAIAQAAETEPDQIESFLATFATITDETRTRLRNWVTRAEAEVPLSSPLGERLIAASAQWKAQIELLDFRIAEMETAVPALQKEAELPAASEEDKQAYRSAQASLNLAKKQRGDLRSEYWVGVLERTGILPNYTLLDDGVTLDVGLSWIDPDTGDFETSNFAYQRNAAQALSDFAPGASFYARGYRVVVDSVDLGADGQAIHTWAFCTACGYSVDITDEEVTPPKSCPRCGSEGIADVSSRLEVVELERASSSMRRDQATIDDRNDERERKRFSIVLLADIDSDHITRAWYVADYGLGVKHVRNLRLTWLNLGAAGTGEGQSLLVGSNEVFAPLFRLCSECGHRDTHSGTNVHLEHRPWCPLRKADEEDDVHVALSRTLVTEGLVVRLPPMVSTGNYFAVPSLAAALRLGLREFIGGDPDHLAIETTIDPDPEGNNHDALLIHDVVPGGTGYLADLADPSQLRAILRLAYDVVANCSCAGTGRLACHRCLLPLAPPWEVRSVSRVMAEQLLADMLTAGASNDDPAAIHDRDLEWELTDVATVTFDPESKLEQQFRAAFRERLHTLGATVKEIPGDSGIRYDIHLGKRRWSLKPQVFVAGSKPDFVLQCTDPNVADIAIFCDGWRYHASPDHNNISDDATKRANLRDAGWQVLAITWDDLQPDAATNSSSAPPGWFNAKSVSVLAKETGLTPSAARLLTQGPMDFLMSWMNHPDDVTWAQLGDTVGLMSYTTSVIKGEYGRRADLAAVAVDILDGQTDMFTAAEGNPTWAWRTDHLALVCRAEPKLNLIEMVLVLDDRDNVLGPSHQDDWATWLQLSNLIGARMTHTRILACSQIEDIRSEAEPMPRLDLVDRPEIPIEYRPLLELATDGEKEFLHQLAESALPPPDVGWETPESGIPIAFVWEEQRVGVNPDSDADELAELHDEGWTIVPADVDQVRQALKEATL